MNNREWSKKVLSFLAECADRGELESIMISAKVARILPKQINFSVLDMHGTACVKSDTIYDGRFYDFSTTTDLDKVSQSSQEWEKKLQEALDPSRI